MPTAPKRVAHVTAYLVVVVVLTIHLGAGDTPQNGEISTEGPKSPTDGETSYLRATIVARVRPRLWQSRGGAPFGINKANAKDATHKSYDSMRLHEAERLEMHKYEKALITKDSPSEKDESADDMNQTITRHEDNKVVSSNSDIMPTRTVLRSGLRSADEENPTSNQQKSNRPDLYGGSARETGAGEFLGKVPETFDVEVIQWNSSALIREVTNRTKAVVPSDMTSQASGVEANNVNSSSLTDANQGKNHSYENEDKSNRLNSGEVMGSSQKMKNVVALDGTKEGREKAEDVHKSQTADNSARKNRKNTLRALHVAKPETVEIRHSSDVSLSQPMETADNETSTHIGKRGFGQRKLPGKKKQRKYQSKEKHSSFKEIQAPQDEIFDKGKKETNPWKSRMNDKTAEDTDGMQADLLLNWLGFNPEEPTTESTKIKSEGDQLTSTDDDNFENVITSGDAEVPFFYLSTTPDHPPQPPLKQTPTTSYHLKTTPLVSAATVPSWSGDELLSTGDMERTARTRIYRNESWPNSTISGGDFKNSTVAKLTSHYEECKSCMLLKRDVSGRTTCGYYDDGAKVFEDWSRKYVEILRYGCPCVDQNHRAQCCHKPLYPVRDALVEVTHVIRSLQQLLLNQCTKCPVDCQWESWGPWSDCPLICDNKRIYSTRSRRKRVIESYEGLQCPGRPTEDKLCPATPNVVGKWLPWSSWSECQGRCEGIRFRDRDCELPTNTVCYTHCVGPDKQFDSCKTSQCCYPRIYTAWSEWTRCSVFDYQNKSSEQVRYRFCEAQPDFIDQPMCPTPCSGSAMEKRSCCYSSWTGWSEWTSCTSSHGKKDLDTKMDCGDGCRNRTRTCLVSPPGCSEPQCDGNEAEHLECKLTPCCVPPMWSEWESWGACSVSGEKRIQTRSRHCHPDPNQWGIPTCNTVGCGIRMEETEEKTCQEECKDCIPPSWGSWHEWSACDFHANPARRSQRRVCHRVPSYNSRCQHLTCEGLDIQHDVCKCDPAQWSTWAEWSQCDLNSTPVIRRRTHSCIQPDNPHYCPQNHCPGPSEQINICCAPPQWETWGQWSSCDYSRMSTQIRRRRCHVSFENVRNNCNRSCEGGQEIEQRTCPLPSTTISCMNCDCVDSCENKQDDYYPSCKQGCQHYIRCCNGKPIKEKCGESKVYDSECRQCTTRISLTCDANKYDIHRYELSIRKLSESECVIRTGTSG